MRGIIIGVVALITAVLVWFVFTDRRGPVVTDPAPVAAVQDPAPSTDVPSGTGAGDPPVQPAEAAQNAPSAPAVATVSPPAADAAPEPANSTRPAVSPTEPAEPVVAVAPVPAPEPTPEPAAPSVVTSPQPEPAVTPAPAPGETTEPVIATAPQPASEPEAAASAPQPAPSGEPDPDKPAVSEPQGTPGFDVVRVDQDGQTVIAGHAAPGANVEILLDGQVVASAEADDTGNFVAVVFATLSGEAQQLQLRVPAPAGPAETEPQHVAAPSAPTAPDTASGQTPSSAAVAASGGDPQTGPVVTPTEPGAPRPLSPGPAPATPDAVVVPSDQGGTVTATVEPSSAADPGLQSANGALLPAPTATEPDSGTEGLAAAPGDLATPPQAAPQEALPDQDPAVSRQVAGLGEGGEASSASGLAGLGGQDGAAIRGQAAALSAPAPVAPSAPTANDRNAARYSLSTPVIILPSAEPDQAPTLVQPQQDALAVLQTGAAGDVRGVVLDRISYGAAGEVQLSGRGRTGKTIRVYGNARPLGAVRVGEDGAWRWSIPESQANALKLLRFDELDDAGGVTSRIETPFEYSVLSPQVMRERRVVIQKGDHLWRIAEQFYGEGVRYSVIYSANTGLIRNPDLIYPGQVFTVPELVDAE